ncbi:MAG: diadenylate cyclase [Spirochaetaceae bacterium]|nr:diadenylate cyclase [Spirochaetaceae bacterium]
MKLRELVAVERVVFLRNRDKRAALAELVQAAARSGGPLDVEAVMDGLWQRELALSSRISDRIAFPHLQIPGFGRTLVVIGRSFDGVNYDSGGDDGHVALIFLILGDSLDPDGHVALLADIAATLRDKRLVERLLQADLPEAVCRLLAGPDSAPTRAGADRISARVLVHAGALAAEVEASTVILHVDEVSRPMVREFGAAGGFGIERRAVLASSHPASEASLPAGFSDQVLIPFSVPSRSSQVEVAILLALSRGVIDHADRVVSVFGLPDTGVLDTVVVTDVGVEVETFASVRRQPLAEGARRGVLERVLQIGRELATQGREGRPVGALFVVGDHERVLGHTSQLVMNPFRGYPDDERNLLDPALDETIKEYALMDGAFVVRRDGVVESAGAFLGAPASPAQTPGLGARHAAAAAITAATDALGIAVSESSGEIRIFKGGQLVLTIG